MSDWKPPIAYVPGHDASCYDSAGTFRGCADNTCPAWLRWATGVDLQKLVYAEYDAAGAATLMKGEDVTRPSSKSMSRKRAQYAMSFCNDWGLGNGSARDALVRLLELVAEEAAAAESADWIAAHTCAECGTFYNDPCATLDTGHRPFCKSGGAARAADDAAALMGAK